MIRIESNSPPPTSLVLSQHQYRADARAQGNTGRARYRDLTTVTVSDIRAHLHAEQSGKCAYCEQRIDNDSSYTKIEHFHPRNRFPELPWDNICQLRTDVSRGNWSLIEISLGNLLLCCKGGEGRGSDRFTCDTKKGNEHICDKFYSPKFIAAYALVRICSSGKAIAHHYPNTRGEAQEILDEVFGLNSLHLVEHRRRVYAASLAEFNRMKDENRGRIPMRALREKLAVKLRDSSKESEFGSTLLSVADRIEAGPQRP